MDVTPDEIKRTVEYPDKIMNCEKCGRCFYLRKFNNKGELLVMAEKTNKINDIKCFGWIRSMANLLDMLVI
ncbi:MAG: hypothetical protein PHH61_06060 [Candidatus Nanoarchaeia archaeon]|nr:hypothetical protein [Candidatus Nanoarchaeia archaeon]